MRKENNNAFATMSARNRTTGFTLVELSLVLVIIGLLVGGVLVGRDLIKASEIRAGISQIEKYNIAVKTFELKYNCLPGDCPDPCFLAAKPPCLSSNNLTIKSVDTDLGNRTFNFRAGAFGQIFPSAKISNMFWHLQLAGLTDGAYKTADWHKLVGKDRSFPPFLTGSGAGMFPFSFERLQAVYVLPPSPYNGGNKWYIGANPAFVDDGSGWGLQEAGGLSDALTPAEAFAIDTKMDNGNPTSGKVQAFWNVTRILHPINGGSFAYGSSYAQNPNATSCASATTSYNLSGSYSNTSLCQLILDAPF